MAKKLIPSLITPGKHFSVYVHKPQGRPAYAMATEGTAGLRDDGSVRSFEYELPGARQHSVNLNGNNTKRNRIEAIGQLLTEMAHQGWIAHDDAIHNLNKDIV